MCKYADVRMCKLTNTKRLVEEVNPEQIKEHNLAIERISVQIVYFVNYFFQKSPLHPHLHIYLFVYFISLIYFIYLRLKELC